MHSEIGIVCFLIFAATGSFGQLPSTVSSNDKLREDIKKSFHKGYEAALQDGLKGNGNEKRYDIATLNQAARNRNSLLNSFGGDPYGMGSTMLSTQQITFGRKKRSIVQKSKRYVGSSQMALKDAYASGYKAGKEMIAKIQREKASAEKRFAIEKTKTRSITNWPPLENNIETIQPGQVYVHVTTVNDWQNIDAQQNVIIRRRAGNVNALGRGFYTYPRNLVNSNDNLFVTFIGWAHLDTEPENADQMREALQVVRIVEISPTKNVRVWKPQGALPGQLHDNLLALSDQNQLNFLAITEHSASQETVWLNAKLDDQVILRYPVEDGSEFEYLQATARPMTEQEINLYVDKVFGPE